MKRVLVGACVVVCVLAPGASARTRNLVPPGFSSISQYTEVIPAGGGGTPADRTPSSPAAALPPAAARALRGLGAARSQLKRFVGETAPQGHPSGGGTAPSSGGSSAVGSLLGSIGGGEGAGGLGVWFPLLLVAALLTAAVLLWRRRVRP